MNRSIILALLAAVVFLGQAACGEEPAATPIARIDRDSPVDFEREILPLLRRNCLACHNETDAESDLVLESPESIMKGGASGPIVALDDVPASLLLRAAAFDEEPWMPPEDNDVGAKRLTSEELGLIQLWIEQGAKGTVGSSDEIPWQPLPSGVNPVYAVALSADGQFAAAGRANQVFLYHVPTKREIGRLTDPNLLRTGVYEKRGVAHLDLVQSLRFSPDGNVLASGGYRTVKLWARERAQKLALRNLEGGISALAISPDSQTAVVGQPSGKIVVVSGLLPNELAAHQDAVTGVAFNVAGTRLYSASLDGTLRAYDSYEQVAVCETPAAILALHVLPDGNLVTGHADHVIRVWNSASIASGAEALLKELDGHSDAVTALAFATTAAQLVSGSKDGSVRVWDLSASKQLRSLDHGGGVQAVAVTADANRIASAGSNDATILWDGKGERIAELRGDLRRHLAVEHAEFRQAVGKRLIANAEADLKEIQQRKEAEEKNVKQATESKQKAEEDLAKKEQAAKSALEQQSAANEKLTATQSVVSKSEADKKVAGESLAQADQQIKAARGELEKARAAMEEASRKLAAAEESREQAVAAGEKADTAIEAAQKQVADIEAEVKKLADSAKKAVSERDSAKNAVAAAGRGLERAGEVAERVAAQVKPAEEQVASAKSIGAERTAAVDAARVRLEAARRPWFAVAFAPDDQTLFTGGESGSVCVWDAQSGKPLRSHNEHLSQVCRIACSAAGDVFTASVDGSLAIWRSMPRWRLVRTIGSPEDSETLVDRVTAIDFSPDGKLLATGSGEPSRNGELKIWDWQSGALVRELQDAHSDTIQGLAFSPDGVQIASSGADRFAKIFDVASGKFVRGFEGHTHHVLSVAWRSDGRWLATSGADNVVKVWNVNTGDQVRTITGFGKEVTGVRFLAATDHVVASSGDNSVQVSNATNGRRVRRLNGAKDFVFGVSASTTGKLIAAGGQDSVLRIWQDDGKVVASFAPPKD